MNFVIVGIGLLIGFVIYNWSTGEYDDPSKNAWDSLPVIFVVFLVGFFVLYKTGILKGM